MARRQAPPPSFCFNSADFPFGAPWRGAIGVFFDLLRFDRRLTVHGADLSEIAFLPPVARWHPVWLWRQRLIPRRCGGGQGGAAGATGGQVDAAGGAGGAGGEIEGGAGDAGGAHPSDGAGGRGGCAGILSFADPNVERAAIQVLDAGPLLAEHARHFDSLRIQFTPSEPLKSLSGLECFTGLRRLDIAGPDLPSWGLVDLSPLAAEGPDSHRVYFDPAFGRDFGPWPHVLDLSPIAKLTGLRTVRFDINSVQDITAIGSLNVVSLFLYSDTLSDLSPLAKVTELGTAFIRGKAIKDVAPLAAALKKQGVRLLLTNTSVSDISSFAALADIRSVGLNDNLIKKSRRS